MPPSIRSDVARTPCTSGSNAQVAPVQPHAGTTFEMTGRSKACRTVPSLGGGGGAGCALRAATGIGACTAREGGRQRRGCRAVGGRVRGRGGLRGRLPAVARRVHVQRSS